MFLMVTFAIPFELVFALNVLPLNLNVTTLDLMALFPCFKFAVNVMLFADFLTVTFFKDNTCFTLTVLDILPPL